MLQNTPKTACRHTNKHLTPTIASHSQGPHREARDVQLLRRPREGTDSERIIVQPVIYEQGTVCRSRHIL
jgi:hypothetical protein